MSSQLKPALLLCALLLPATEAAAVAVCDATVIDLSFGSFTMNPGTAAQLSSGTVSVSCDDNGVDPLQTFVAYDISLDAGTGGSFNPRSMGGTGNPLEYNVYIDANGSIVWGDGVAGGQTVAGVLPALPGRNDHIAYGQVVAGQTGIESGLYADSLVVTITY